MVAFAGKSFARFRLVALIGVVYTDTFMVLWDYSGICRRTMEAEFEYRPELSTTGEQEENKICDSCGEPFYAYEIPGRSEYKCKDCK